MHIVLRLSDRRVRIFDGPEGTSGRIIGHAVVGGARAAPYLRDVSGTDRSVGALLEPGAGEPLFGVPADVLAGCHTSLEDLWGGEAGEARERLSEAGSVDWQLDVLESMLAARLRGARALHPAVVYALRRFRSAARVGDVVHECGYSHRRFIELFEQAVGLSPKLYCRLLRFQGALDRIAGRPFARWTDLALDAGYSDQAHFIREFREFTGISPTEYRAAAPATAHHVPVVRVNSVQDDGTAPRHVRCVTGAPPGRSGS